MTLALQDVSKVVGAETYIDDVSLELAEGSFNVLLGLTLAGKTTLMRLMAGLDRPTKGRVLVEGRDVTGVSVRKRNVAMVYQQFINYPSLSCYENIASPLRLAGIAKAEIDSRVRAEAPATAYRAPARPAARRIVGRTAATRRAGAGAGQGGAVAAAGRAARQPRLQAARGIARGDAADVRRRPHDGRLCHDRAKEALLLGGNTAVIDKGRLLQYGPTLEVYRRPASMSVSEIFSDPPINLARASIGPDGCRLSPEVRFPARRTCARWRLAPYRVGVRANHIELAQSRADATPIPVAVELAEISGSETYIHARHADMSDDCAGRGRPRPTASARPSVSILDPRRLFVFSERRKAGGRAGSAAADRRAS